MNSLYSLGLRQTASIQTDLDKMRAGDLSPSLQGQIVASLSTLSRTIDDYDSMAKREMIADKQKKALARVQKFRTDHTDLRSQLDALKREAATARTNAQRSELLGTTTSIPLSPSIASTTSRQRAYISTPVEESPFNLRPAAQSSTVTRESHALREQSFLTTAEQQLDDFLAQGREVLDNLVDQKSLLKGTHKRLLDAANTLGLSRDVIGWIERRSRQDVAIFFAGAIFTLVSFYYIWKWFG